MVNHSQVGVKLIQDDGVRLRTNHYYEQKKLLKWIIFVIPWLA